MSMENGGFSPATSKFSATQVVEDRMVRDRVSARGLKALLLSASSINSVPSASRKAVLR